MRHLLVFALSLPLLVTLRAETATAEKAPATASFRFIGITNPGELCVRVGKDKYERIHVGLGAIGSPIRLPMASRIELTRNENIPLNTPVKPGAPVGAFSPLNSPRQLVLLAQGSQNTIEGRAMPDTAETVPFGRTMVLNFTTAPILLTLNDHTVTVAPRRTALCPVSAETKPSQPDTRVRVVARRPDGDKLVYSTAWPAGGDTMRTLVFVVENADGGIRVSPVTDVDSPALREAPSDKKTKKPGATR